MSNRHFSALSVFASAAALAVLVATASLAGEEGEAGSKSVIELFTSQGCSSCPPADALLMRLARRPDLIALTLPVDYWDYLGWKDTLASPVYSARQRAYAKVRGDHAVYTPQVVIDGLRHAVGADLAAIEQALKLTRLRLAGQHVPVKTSLGDDTFFIEIGESRRSDPRPSAVVWLALIKSSVPVNIERGENAGKQIVYTNVVRDLMPVGKWTGEGLTLKLPAYKLMMDDADGCVVLLQQGMTGPILGAVMHSAK